MDHDGSVLNSISDYLNNFRAKNSDGILDHVFGNKRPEVEKRLRKKEGLDIGTIYHLLTIATPIIMGALGKKKKKEGLIPDSLSNLLGRESSQAQSLSPVLGMY